jgi:putative lipoic acid-binding regulatory protein
MDSDKDVLFQFPCDFPIKVMGRALPGFREQVVDIVSNHVPYLPEHAISSTASKNGNYISVTVLITATSRAQLDNIYRELTACETVLMVL